MYTWGIPKALINCFLNRFTIYYSLMYHLTENSKYLMEVSQSEYYVIVTGAVPNDKINELMFY